VTLAHVEVPRPINTRQVARDVRSGHRRYDEQDVDALQTLACLRAMGVGIEDMRIYQANRVIGRAAAGEQRDLLTRHAERIEREIETLHVHLRYLEAKAGLWDARDRGDATPRPFRCRVRVRAAAAPRRITRRSDAG
jgi:DNA-binding transcriptional MerR regulator